MTSSSIASYLAHFRRYYPDILQWYSQVEDEIASGRRSVFVVWNGSDVEGLAITKNGQKAKLCHISVSPKVRDRGLGRTLMRSALGDMVDRGAREIRVTTDEQVFNNHAAFFLAGGFEVVDWQVNRYRPGTSELLWKFEVDPDIWKFRGFDQRCKDLKILAPELGQIEDRHVGNKNADRELQHWHTLFGFPRSQESLRENTIKLFCNLGADGLDPNRHYSIFREMLRRHEGSERLLENTPASEKGFRWIADEQFSAKVRRWKRKLMVIISAT